MRNWVAWFLFGRPREEPVGAVGRPAAPKVRLRLQTVAAVSVLVAGVVGIVAVINGRLDTDDVRVLASSLGFAIFSSTAAAGAAARREGTGATAWVGIATVVLSAMSLFTLELAVWATREVNLRMFGCVGLLTLAASHASIVLRPQRPDDSPPIRLITAASILSATAECGSGAVILAARIHIADPRAYIKATAVLVIATFVTTAIPPLLRASRKRVRSGSPPPPRADPGVVAQPPRPLVAPTTAIALAAVTALAGFLLGAASAKPERPRVYAMPPAPVATPGYVQPVSSPATPPPPPATPRIGQPIHLPKLIEPVPLFNCPDMGGGPPQRNSGPGGVGNFELVEVARGPRGLCLHVRGAPVSNFWYARNAPAAITLELQRPHTNGDPHKYRVTLSGSQYGRALFSITLQAPGDREPPFTTKAVVFGRLGMSAREAAVLVEGPRLPDWALRPTTRWRLVFS